MISVSASSALSSSLLSYEDWWRCERGLRGRVYRECHTPVMAAHFGEGFELVKGRLLQRVLLSSAHALCWPKQRRSAGCGEQAPATKLQ